MNIKRSVPVNTTAGHIHDRIQKNIRHPAISTDTVDSFVSSGNEPDADFGFKNIIGKYNEFNGVDTVLGSEIKPLGGKIWSCNLEGPICTTPDIDSQGTVFVGTFNGKLCAVDRNGEKKWVQESNHCIFTPVCGKDGNIYATSNTRSLYSYAEDGTKKWEFQAKDRINSVPRFDRNGNIYVGSRDHNLYACDKNGNKKWEYQAKGSVDTIATGPDDTVYLAGTILREKIEGAVHALDKNGNLKWEVELGTGIAGGLFVSGDGTAYVPGFNDNLYSISKDGQINWQMKLNALIPSTPTEGPDGTIYVGCNDKKLHALDKSGNQKWEFETGNHVRTTPCFDKEGNIYFGSCDHKLYALDKDGKLKWEFETGGSISSSPVTGPDGNVYFGSEDGNLYGVNTRTIGEQMEDSRNRTENTVGKPNTEIVEKKEYVIIGGIKVKKKN